MFGAVSGLYKRDLHLFLLTKTPFWGEVCEEQAHQLLLPGECAKQVPLSLGKLSFLFP